MEELCILYEKCSLAKRNNGPRISADMIFWDFVENIESFLSYHPMSNFPLQCLAPAHLWSLSLVVGWQTTPAYAVLGDSSTTYKYVHQCATEFKLQVSLLVELEIKSMNSADKAKTNWPYWSSENTVPQFPRPDWSRDGKYPEECSLQAADLLIFVNNHISGNEKKD